VSNRMARVRMAPSPTGYVHLGSARTALFNLLFARQQGGSFVLRIDDTDLERNQPEYEQAIYESFHWLGLDWDEGPDKGGGFGPYRQSERLDLYRQAAAKLLETGAAYRCYCTREELQAERAEAQRQGQPYRYSRRCLVSPPADWQTRKFTVRFKIPEGETTFTDMVRGEMRFDNDVLGDPVIVKANGWPTYNFASPVDDALMEITHVLRGEEHLSNTPIQLLLLDALGHARTEAYAHLPVIVGKDHKKLSKRLHPEARLGYFRELGYLPEALVNYLALLGWNPGTEQEVFTLDELVRAFDIARVQKASAMFDWEKLDWLNGQHIRALSDDELACRLRPYLPDLPEATVRAAAPALKERLPRLSNAAELLRYLQEEPPPPQLDESQLQMIRAAAERLQDVDWTPAAIEGALEEIREAHGWSRGKFFNPLRAAIAGRDTPPIHDTLALLPKQEALARMRRVLPWS
jgi:nondiscriminating glutamyl-tRNA synthetase